MPFTLKKDATDYVFDTDGSVKFGAASGTWSVDDENQVVVTTAASQPVSFPVGWSFIDNQLWLTVDGAKTFNFHSGGFPDYRIVGNEIEVSPRIPASPFAFVLHADLSLDDNIDLVVKIGSTTTKLVGRLEDTKGQFIYRFTDKTLGAQDALILAGEWRRNDQVDGDIHLNFVYRVGGAERTISIPRGFEVNPFTNSLRLRYEKEGAVRSLELAGEIGFRNGSTVVFAVRKSGGNGKSEIAVDFRFNGTGKTIKTVDLRVLKRNGTDGSRVLQVGGTLEARFGGNGLTITFAYAKVSGGSAGTRVTLAVGGKFTLSQGGAITFSYKKEGSNSTLSIVATDVQLGSVVANAGTQITQNGTQRSVRVFAGLSW